MTIKDLRNKINAIDKKLVGLLNDRAKISQSIGKEKNKDKAGVYAPDREQAVLNNVNAFNSGPLTKEVLDAIYREIMSGSLNLERISQIAYLGTEGSFTHLAARKKFGSSVKYSSCGSILDIFQQVEQDDCDYGVVPIENSIEGVVTYTADLLVDSDLKICSQVLLKIEHNLISRSKSLKSIKKVYSNPHVFGQCRRWLSQHLRHAQEVNVSSTTEAVERASKDKTIAAVASSEAARMFKMNILKAKIQDMAHNTTKFFVIGKQQVPPTGKDKTSILFSIKDEMGALHRMLTPFYLNKINLTKIESRPSKKKAWDYYFFVDFEGHQSDKNVKKALTQLESMCKDLKVIGSYPNS